jgi:hypothetical protein
MMEDQMPMLKNAAFDEFVKSQQGPAHPEIDWNLRRNEWLRYLDELYVQIEGFLKDYIDSDQIEFEPGEVELNEENIGTYTARRITLKIGRKVVNLIPVGTLLIGSKGRVDVIGPSGTGVPLLLVDSNAVRASDMIRVYIGLGGKKPVAPKKEYGEIKWEWRMITRPPERRFIEITQETFFQMIMEVANG